MDRNNTGFVNKLNEEINTYLANNKNNFLKESQIIPYQYILHSNTRGLLIYHSTGSGKTLIGASIASYYLQHSKKEVIVISPKSLQANFIKDIKFYNKKLNFKITEDELNKIIDQYKFVSSNASNMLDQLSNSKNINNILGKVNKISLDNKIVIIDEAHNIFNSIVNGSKITNEFYDLVMKAKNIKLIFLTATPIINSFFEIVPMVNMLSGYISDKLTILPESYDDFVKYFIDTDKMILKNTDKLKNRLLGFISYSGDLFRTKYTNITEDLFVLKQKDNFPDQLPLIIEKVKMSNRQCVNYGLARDKERIETGKAYNKKGGNEKYKTKYDDKLLITGGIFEKSNNKTSTTYRIKSRQISNIYLPEENIELADFNNINEYSPKIKTLWKNIKKYNNQLGMIYSGFLKYGLTSISKFLEIKGYKLFDINNIIETKTYAIYTGDISADDRAKIIQTYNNPENKYGKHIQLILISSSGAEGLSLKCCRHVHIMEPYWNMERIIQISARAIRYMSHTILPEKEKNVQVYLYLSIFSDEYLLEQKTKLKKIINEANKINNKLSEDELKLDPPTDIQIFKGAIKKKEINDELNKLLASISIECNHFNSKINFDCYNCFNVNNQKLFSDNIDQDMLLSNPCMKGKKVTVTEVIYNNEKYYYDTEYNLYKEINNKFITINDPEIINKIKSN